MGNEYYYKVAGVNQFGEGALSRYTFAVIAVPPVPAGIIGTALSESEIIVSWNAVSGASTYKLYRADNSDGSFTLINTINAPDVTYTDTSLEPVTEYFYCVSAVNGIGESEQSTVASTVTKISPPETINASPGLESSISISWTEVDGTIDYNLYRSTNTDGPYELIATTPDLSYSDTVSDITQTYYYKVSAMTINGESALSIYACVSFTVPDSPSGLNAVPLSTTSMSIFWDAVPGAFGYKLYQSTTTPTGEYSLIATVDKTTYTHSNLTVNTDYFYKVFL